MAELTTEEVARALAVARDLTRHGIPVLVAYPDRGEDGRWRPDGGHGHTGYRLSRGWQATTANPAYVDAWRSGCALIAVMGHGLDLLDVDPRNGGDATRATLLEADLWPRVYGSQDTPSGGSHAFVASLGVRSRDAVRPGLDVKAGINGDGHGFAFLAPTVKLSKVTGELAAYRWTTVPLLDDVDLGEDDSGAGVAELVRGAHGGTRHDPGQLDGTGELPDWVSALTGATTPKGARYPRLRSLAGWCRHHGIALDDARQLVAAAWERCDQPADYPMPWGDALALVDDVYARYASGQVDLTSWLPENEAGTEPAGRRVRLTPASQIKPRPVRWTWANRLPVGEVCLTPGRGGVGKSTFHAWVVAQLTCGTLPGVYQGTPGAAIIAATEDSWERTIVPRLMAASADMAMVYRADVVSAEGAELSLTLPADCTALAAEVERVGAALVSLDPLMSTINGTLDTHKDRDVRHALDPLARLADRTGVTVLGNAHFNKSSGSDPLSLIMGSAAFGNVVRAALAFARDEDDEDGSCVISQVKNNLGRLDLPSLRYRIDAATVDTDEGPAEVGRLVMLGESDRSVADILRDRGDRDDRDDRDAAVEWLRGLLSAGPIKAAEVYRSADAAGLSKDQAKRAKKRLGVVATHPDIPGPWFWELPQGSAKGAKGAGDANGAPLHPLGAPLGGPSDGTDCPACHHPLAEPPPDRCSATAWHGTGGAV